MNDPLAAVVAALDPVARAERKLARLEAEASKAGKQVPALLLRVDESQEKLARAIAGDDAADVGALLKDLSAAKMDLAEAEQTSAGWAGVVGEARARHAAAVAEARRKSLEGEMARGGGEAAALNARLTKVLDEARSVFSEGARVNVRQNALARELRIVGAVAAFDPDAVERAHRLAAIRELSEGAGGPPEAGTPWIEERLSLIAARAPIAAGIIE